MTTGAAATAAALAATIDPIVHEAILLAAALFLIGGLDDLLLDLFFLARCRPDRLLADLPPAMPGRIALFVPTWREERVIGAMLSRALEAIDGADACILIGCYPNDPDTIAAAQAIAARDDRVHVIVGPRAGPTTKADCLNNLWQALLRGEAAGAPRAIAVVLHDAEDVIDPGELAVHAALLRDHALVQVPVIPLIDPRSRWVSGHYADEFADGHARQLVARAAIGAALPLAGVGCAIRRDALELLARDGAPFDADSLTEDYELGIGCGARGLPACFARVRTAPGGHVIATRAFFPGTITAAVRQKARWMTGIALAGWDRTGWGGRLRPAEWWMRMRDRRAPLAVVALAAGYLALVLWVAAAIGHRVAGDAPPAMGAQLAVLVRVNAVLLAWRLAMRVWSTAQVYGWREGVRAVPRMVVANIIAMMAARRAVMQYVRVLRGARLRWDKTAHHFPEELAPS